MVKYKMTKLDNGKNWYVLDLNNYTSEFLIEIIEDLSIQLELLKDELNGKR